MGFNAQRKNSPLRSFPMLCTGVIESVLRKSQPASYTFVLILHSHEVQSGSTTINNIYRSGFKLFAGAFRHHYSPDYKFKSSQASKPRLHSSKRTGNRIQRKMAILGHSRSRVLESAKAIRDQRWKWVSGSLVKWVTIFGWVTWVMARGHSQ